MENAELIKMLKGLSGGFEDFKARIENRFHDLEAAVNRPPMYGGFGPQPELSEEMKGFNAFLRQGIQNAMKVSEDPAGGYFVPAERSEGVMRIMAEYTPLRQYARVETITTGDAFEEVLDRDQAGATWVGETESRGETDTPDVGLFRVPVREVQAEPKITQKLLDVANYDVGAWLESKLGETFGASEASAYTSGNGIARPRGFLSYPVSTDPDETRAWGEIEYIPTGGDGAFNSTDPADAFIDCSYALKAQYRTGAVWMMARRTAGALRKLKDGDGTYLWQPSAVAGQPDSFVGFPVVLAEDMPAISSGSLSVAFGNFNKGYIIVDHGQMTILRDPFTAKPWVKFYTTKRTGGDVFNFEAIKLMKFSES